jgi:hypothetical protein
VVALSVVFGLSLTGVQVTVTLARRNLILLAAGACVSALLEPLNSQAQTDEKAPVQDPDEYSVYNTLLNSQYKSDKLQQFVINSETVGKTKQPFIGLRAGLAPTGAKRPDADAATMSDFDAKNDKSFSLERRFDLKAPYVLVTSDELHAIFGPDASGNYATEGWADFYKQYPGAVGILGLSRVGFSSKKNQALMYVEIQRNLLGGSGAFFVLSMAEKTWEVQKQVVLWFS